MKRKSQPAKQPQIYIFKMNKRGWCESTNRSAKYKYLDKYIRSTTLTYTRIPMRIHDSDGPVVQWSEVQYVQCPPRCRQEDMILKKYNVECKCTRGISYMLISQQRTFKRKQPNTQEALLEKCRNNHGILLCVYGRKNCHTKHGMENN